MTASHEPPRQTYRFTVAEVLQMVAAGLLADARVELLDGELICMTAKGPLHVFIAASLHARLLRASLPGCHVRKEDPVIASESSLPEPDVSLVRGDPSDFRTSLPHGSDCILVVEVSVSTLEADRRKLAVYAAARVPEVWILDVEARHLERYWGPVNGAYAFRQVLLDQETVDVPFIGERWVVGTLFD